MTILPPLDPIRIGDPLAAAMSQADGCPCGNTEPPRAAIPTGLGWLISYLCSDCGRAWTLKWSDN